MRQQFTIFAVVSLKPELGVLTAEANTTIKVWAAVGCVLLRLVLDVVALGQMLRPRHGAFKDKGLQHLTFNLETSVEV